jgi:tetratricopeptide (TPR) repeat protein
MNQKIEQYKNIIVSGNFKAFISTLKKEDINEESTLYLFDKIDDFILEMVETEASKMEPFILSTIKFYKKVGLWESCGYSMNTLFSSYFHQKKTQNLLELFYEAMKFVSDKELKIVGLSFLMGLKRVIHFKEINIDEALVCKRLAVKFLLDFDEFENAIEEMCNTSFLFAEINDHQGAYRLLNDAEELAKSKKMTLPLSNVYETLGSIAFYESDFKYSNKAFEESIRIKNGISEEIPISLKSNLAASKMNLYDYKGAITIYESLLNKSTIEEEEEDNLVTRGVILTNYSVCERKIGNYKKSQKLIKKAIPLFLNQPLIDSLIEAYLVASKTELKIGNQKETLKYLRFAVDSIEVLISQNYRLHYRRGVRERYHNRIKHLLSKTSIHFISKKDLKILIFLKSNTNSDWLSLINIGFRIKIK